MNEIFTVAGIAVVSAGFVILLKQYKPEYAFGAALAAGIILLFNAIILAKDVFDYMSGIIEYSGIAKENFGILVRCFAICVVAKIASDLCNDCGQGSIASKVSFAGKIFVFITALPLFSEIMEVIESLINL
ncbi:MAG: hypothetical protein IKJ82_05740 [Oscillospiraceae bacterium]|nr:hypothetical protein [Oscillospiraceae bacterium]